jgi:hypothetical protein
MKTKFLIPVLAAIFAIGMSFTTLDSAGNPSQDYIVQDGVFMPLGEELNCGNGSIVCRVQLEPNGQIYEVYDSINPSVLKKGNGDIKKLY